MIDGWKSHWWSTRYNAKYLDPVPVTKEEVWDQLVVDFAITDEKDKRAVFDNEKKHDQLLKWIDQIVENRGEANKIIRIPKEYYLRSRILNLFPSSLDRYLKIKNAENAESVMPVSENLQEYLEKRKIKTKKTNPQYEALKAMFKD